MNAKHQECHRLIEAQQYKSADLSACTPLWLQTIRTGGGINAYDYRQLGRYPFMTTLTQYMGRPDVMSLLGVPPDRRPTDTCVSQLFSQFLVEFQKDYSYMLPSILKHTRVLLFSGQFDVRASVMGTEEWVRVLQWDGKPGFNSLQHDIFYTNNVTSGIWKSHKNLTHLVVYGAGHMSPFDQPLTTLDMFTRFINKQSFCSYSNNMDIPGGPHYTCNRVECPNKCSGSTHGSCSNVNKQCSCNPGFSEEDCSVSNSDLLFNRATTNEGSIFGNTFHAYYVNLVGTGSGLYNLKLELQKKGDFGKPHVYVQVGKSFVAPNESFVDSMRAQYPYSNTEDIDLKTVQINDLDRYQGTKISVIVYNNVHTDLQYTLRMWTEPPGPPVDGFLVVSSMVFIGSTGTALVLFIVALVQFVMNRQLQNAQLHYSAQSTTPILTRN